MKIMETKGWDKNGRLVQYFYGVIRIQGERTKETLFTRLYRNKNTAKKRLLELTEKNKNKII